jgi:hypothetical protein
MGIRPLQQCSDAGGPEKCKERNQKERNAVDDAQLSRWATASSTISGLYREETIVESTSSYPSGILLPQEASSHYILCESPLSRVLAKTNPDYRL